MAFLFKYGFLKSILEEVLTKKHKKFVNRIVICIPSHMSFYVYIYIPFNLKS